MIEILPSYLAPKRKALSPTSARAPCSGSRDGSHTNKRCVLSYGSVWRAKREKKEGGEEEEEEEEEGSAISQTALNRSAIWITAARPRPKLNEQQQSTLILSVWVMICGHTSAPSDNFEWQIQAWILRIANRGWHHMTRCTCLLTSIDTMFHRSRIIRMDC